MVDEEKIKLMTQLAIYENGEGKKEIPISKYYKRDYVKYNMLKTVVMATVGYGLIALGVVMINAESLLNKINDIDYVLVVYVLLASYLGFILIYCIASKIIYSKRYDRVKPNIIIYNHNLKKLIKYYDKNPEDNVRLSEDISLSLEDAFVEDNHIEETASYKEDENL